MAKRYLVTQPSYIGETLLSPGHTVDADDDFVPSPHLVVQPGLALPADAQFPVLLPAPPAAAPVAGAPAPAAPAAPPLLMPATVNVRKGKKK